MCDRPLFEMTGVAARPLQQVTNDCGPSKAIGCSHDTGALIKCGHTALIECPRPSQSRLCVCARKLRRNPPASLNIQREQRRRFLVSDVRQPVPSESNPDPIAQFFLLPKL